MQELEQQHRLRLRNGCGGGGRCGHCRVTLLAGEWNINGSRVEIPPEGRQEALACRTRLVSNSAEVLVPLDSLPEQEAHSLNEWTGRPLPPVEGVRIGIDLGTTTVVAVAVQQAKVLARASAFNAQRRFGDDVVTRIAFAGTPGGLEKLRLAALDTLNLLLEQLGVSQAAAIAVSANATMALLLHGIDPTPLGKYPFPLPVKGFPVRDGLELGLHCHGPVYTVPPAAAYLGGDLVAGLPEVVLEPGEMLVDIGTNCEMVLHTGRELLCGAAAAGPAFEGAGLACACSAQPGAVDHVMPGMRFSRLPGGTSVPPGLCGSALVDLLAVLKNMHVLDEYGHFCPPQRCLFLWSGKEISARDVEELLKAKAAVFSGIQALAEAARMPVKRLFLAGGFARWLNLANAVDIGLLPSVPAECVGNTSLLGAARLACEPSRLSLMQELAGRLHFLHFNDLPNYQDWFLKGLKLAVGSA